MSMLCKYIYICPKNMDERCLKKLVIPSFIIVVFAVFFYEGKHIVDKLFFKKKHILIIGILSAPENFQQRLSIRKTWLQLLSDISASSYFIIGNEICEVPPLDRADPYSCVHHPFSLPLNTTTETEFSTMTILEQNLIHKTYVPNFLGFGFYVKSQILVRKLGILKEILKIFNCKITVKLLSSLNRVLASVTFHPTLLDETHSKVILKAIKPVVLHKDSEAFIKLEVNKLENVLFPDCKLAVWENGPKVINYIQLWSNRSIMPQPFRKESCTYVLMIYTIIDLENIKKCTESRSSRLKEWNRYNRNLSLQLQNENRIYNDIMFVDVIDVYRNLSLKLINFYKRIVDSEYFHYVLKTDDDSFIDLLRIHNQLLHVKKETNTELSLVTETIREDKIICKPSLSRFWWWSYFREYWKVQYYGKWKENQYRSASYPTFPCGGGYVINKEIVDYLMSIQQHLNHFQGEDISLGIWLSPLSVHQYYTPNVIMENVSFEIQEKLLTKFKGSQYWMKFKTGKRSHELANDECEWTCDNGNSLKLPSCNKVQLSIEKMYDTWNDYITNGYL